MNSAPSSFPRRSRFSVSTHSSPPVALAGRRSALRSLVVSIALSLLASAAQAQTIYVLTTTGKLASAPLTKPGALSAGFTITGIAAGEILVGIDVRPQNQQIYGLGVNATANTATLYHLAPETGIATAVGVPGSIAFTADGVTPVDFPNSAIVGWDIDFNPVADRLRVVAGSLNFRVNPNSGAGVDADNTGLTSGTVAGTNPDGPINGGTTTVGAVAYTNNHPDGNVTTLYTLDASSNSLFIQNPANTGTQTLGQTVTLNGSPLDFTNPLGFDIPVGVNAPASGSAVAVGPAFAALNVGGTTGLFSINLASAVATRLGDFPEVRSIAIRTHPTKFNGVLVSSGGDVAGFATAKISSKGIATLAIVGGTVRTSARIAVPSAPSAGTAFTNLGNITLERNMDGTLSLTIAALGGSIQGTLRGVIAPIPAAIQTYHIALASIDADYPGGGYAIARLSKKGAVAIKGLLPDGLPFSASTALRDNGTIAFYSVVAKGAKPPAIVGGELLTASLASTDVTGELDWFKLPQVTGTKGLHLDGVDTILTATGCLYDGTDIGIGGGAGLTLFGGNLAMTEFTVVGVSDTGIPAVPTGSLQTWTGVKLKTGRFSATVTVPGVAKPVKGTGLYFPKSASAFGFFPGTTVGGRILLLD